MSWPMPTAGPWNPMAMTPDMSAMGNYSAGPWAAALQQQNWQQWAQWQQQYAQWQSQYGDKYAQQMQMQMGGMPPLPTTTGATAPAPPPPENPPPPPPHENNQPLYASGVSAPESKRHNTAYSNQTAGNANAEALKKLAEEERLFDIQFQKWEEEIAKWKQENVNHPDKEAYKEYEAKFESCRAQLLERRQQMKQKRARLMSSAAPPPPPPAAAHPSTIIKPAPPANPAPTSIYNNQTMHTPQVIQPTSNYPNQSNNQNQQYLNMINISMQNRNTNVNPQDRMESYQNMDNYSKSSTVNSSFLPVGDSTKGIPGLDLVPEAERPQREVIDITGDYTQKQSPDYSKISKGINNILGDEKIMNILSLVRDTIAPEVDKKKSAPGGVVGMSAPPTAVPPPSGMGGPGGDFGMLGGNFGGYGGNYSGPVGMFSGPGPMYGGIGGNYGAPGGNFGGPGGNYGPDSSMPQNNQWNQYNNQQQYNQQNNGFYYNSQGMQNPPISDSRQDSNQGGMPQNQYNQLSGPRGGPPPLMATPIAPPMQDMAEQRNIQDPSRVYNNNSGVHENNVNQPPKPKWVEEPLFTPSIVVDYEHKPLRLKAREFIEPVHMFDYNHISKDEEYKKKDFEKEAEDLFTRKPRRLDDDHDKNERVPRDVSRDFEYDRRPREDNRDDYRQRVPPRDEDRRMPRESFMERRPPREELIERRPHRDELVERRPPRDEFVEKRPPRDEFVERRPPRDEFIERRPPRDESERRPPRDDFEERRPPRDEIEDRRRLDTSYFERRRDDRDRNSRREDTFRDRDRYRSDHRREENPRSRSHERFPSRDLLKRGHSKESEDIDSSKRSKDSEAILTEPKHVVMIDDLLEHPGREMRPDKIVIILRGPPGSGKSYLAKLIRDREAEHGGSVRIMSVDDYFMLEGEVEETDPTTGKIIKKPTLKYEYDSSLEEAYLTSLKRAFKRSLTDGYYSFLIFDAVNDQLRSYADMWNFARQNGFQVYICTMELDPQICFKRNIHNRTLEDIQVICSRFYPTPAHHIQLDATTLLQNAAITDVQMEDATNDDVLCQDAQDTEELMPKGAAPSQVENSFTSKWEKMDDVAQLARLDGTSKPLRSSHISMEDYLQLDEWKPNESKPGKKTVRWADIEERREQEKMRAIGFVVGQTDWNRMTDPTMGSSALTKTKYIERVRRDL